MIRVIQPVLLDQSSSRRTLAYLRVQETEDQLLAPAASEEAGTWTGIGRFVDLEPATVMSARSPAPHGNPSIFWRIPTPVAAHAKADQQVAVVAPAATPAGIHQETALRSGAQAPDERTTARSSGKLLHVYRLFELTGLNDMPHDLEDIASRTFGGNL